MNLDILDVAKTPRARIAKEFLDAQNPCRATDRAGPAVLGQVPDDDETFDDLGDPVPGEMPRLARLPGGLLLGGGVLAAGRRALDFPGLLVGGLER